MTEGAAGGRPLEDDLEDLFENAPCGYLSLGADGLIVKANRTLSGWLGKPAAELCGKRLRDLLTVPGRIFYETHFAPLLRMQGYFNEVALDLVTASGASLAVLANARERRSADGALLFTRVALFQAADRRRYERELVDAREAAAAASAVTQSSLDSERQTAELRDQFIAVLGHDLRNPLASIDAGLRMLGRSEVSPKSGAVIELMHGSVTRMSGLISNVMDFARGRLGGGIILDRRALLLEPLLQQIISELRFSHPGRTIVTEIDLPEPVYCDAIRIGQLASNLLGNALSHGDADRPVHVGARVRDGVLTLWVANGGDPIPDSAMAHLFKPFFRGDVRASQQGLGLGLHIASEIARAHGGSIDVASDATETRFTFTMSATA